jgi:branched-chain amino acid transport system permease protein
MTTRIVALHAAVLITLFVAQFLLSDYATLSLTRIMVLAVFAIGYNLMFGYTGLLSLGHSMFFAVGVYTAALSVARGGFAVPAAFGMAVLAGACASAIIASVCLRAKGVAFMIVTLMFAQATYLTVLYFGEYTRGDEGIVLGDKARQFSLFGLTVDLTSALLRYNLALALLSLALVASALVVMSPMGRVLTAIRENENRTEMLGYNPYKYKFAVTVVSGTLSAVSGAAYVLLFAYAGATLASIEYSINPLLWTLLGGASTLLGPLLGTGMMFVLRDITSSYTDASLLAVGVVLVLLVLFFPKGILGTLREKRLPWLP